jgi:hypothetical protein
MVIPSKMCVSDYCKAIWLGRWDFQYSIVIALDKNTGLKTNIWVVKILYLSIFTTGYCQNEHVYFFCLKYIQLIPRLYVNVFVELASYLLKLLKYQTMDDRTIGTAYRTGEWERLVDYRISDELKLPDYRTEDIRTTIGFWALLFYEDDMSVSLPRWWVQEIKRM